LSLQINNATIQINAQAIAQRATTGDNKVESWRRGDHSTVCKNATPSYCVPENHKKRLAFISDLVEKSLGRDVTRSDEAMFSRAQNLRQKQFYPDRAKAINALHAVFSEHVNIVTHQIEISIRNASDAAGLSTTSENEENKHKEDKTHTPVVSISRASRAFKDMVDLGWLVAPDEWQVWDNERKQWIDKYYEATALFFNCVGITTERVEKQRNSRLGFIKKNHHNFGYTEAQAGRLSIARLKADRKVAWRRAAFERRATLQTKQKIKRELNDKARTVQRNIASKRVLSFLGEDIYKIDHHTFKELVNKEIATIRKFTGVQPPPH
jgi:hypothetical protein